MTNLYIETHQLTTNSNGLLTCLIGSGQPFLGMMDTIDWSLGNVYIQTEIDLTGGNNFVTLGNQELLSVPYALYSLSSGSSTPGPQGPIGPTGPQGSFPPGTQPGEMNYWNGSAWVAVSPGNHGQNLFFCNGQPSWGGCRPLVTTTAVTSITHTGATTGGNVTSDGGATVTARGVAYDTAQTPTTANNTTSNGTGTGAFTSTLSGLTLSTLYYVRAYATNAVGTAYGSQVSFTTSAAAPSFTCGTSTVTDVDNNSYNTVQIGTQCWTQSNLKVSKYRNGDNIPTGLSNSAWQGTTSGAYAIYSNDPVNDGLYGKLYNHYAVTDGRGLCPTGWHVPSDAEWTTL
ncbi:MAG: FISUMP domain-containing protein, partial [Bacteroidota bacterium]